MKKILFIPPQHWYMEAHYEYIIRNLSDEFFFDMGTVPYPPNEDFIERYPETSPMMKNPDDFDLIVPILASHWGVEPRDYKHKSAVILYEPGEGKWHNAQIVGTTTPAVESVDYQGKPTHSLRFGIDTELFKPLKMLREDKLLHVGVVGTHNNPRRQVEEAMKPLFNLKGIRWMFFPTTWVNDGGTAEKMESLGGMEFVKRVAGGEKTWPGIPNVYNRMDVLVRIDNSFGYSFPTLEAAACGVPVIATYQGIDHHITGAGGGILLLPKDANDKDIVSKRWPFNQEEELVSKLKDALVYMRDHKIKRREMGKKARAEVMQHWTWEQHLPAWRKFFRKALELV